MPYRTYTNATIYGQYVIVTEQPFERYPPKQTGHKVVQEHRKLTLSENGKRSIKRLLTTWFDTVSLTWGLFRDYGTQKMYFITLTLPSVQCHCDKTINDQCYQEFLKELTRIYRGVYFWTVERQKNGNLHYHIIYNKNVPVMHLRKIWNAKINRLGYVDRYQSKMKDRYKNGFWYDEKSKASIETQWKRYQYGQATDWKSPNSTDIKFIDSPKKMANYISKYVSKNDVIMCGKCWGKSQGLDYIKPFSDHVSDEIDKVLRNPEHRRIFTDHATIIAANVLHDLCKAAPEVYSHYDHIAKSLSLT